MALFESPLGPAALPGGAVFTAEKNSDCMIGSLHQSCALPLWQGNTVSDCTPLPLYNSVAKLNHSSFDIGPTRDSLKTQIFPRIMGIQSQHLCKVDFFYC